MREAGDVTEVFNAINYGCENGDFRRESCLVMTELNKYFANFFGVC